MDRVRGPSETPQAKLRDSVSLDTRRKLVRMVEKRKGMCHWMAGDAVTLRFVANSRTTSG
jgi:hypothetical protein